MILVIDNYDSFTFNIVQMLRRFGEDVDVHRNDPGDWRAIIGRTVSGLVISPGPGRPEDAGCSMDMIRFCDGSLPVLGICLGHQAVAEVYGGRVVRASRILHGKTSLVNHDGLSLFRNLPSPFQAGRYHSLIVDVDSLPDCLEVTAWTGEGEIMGLRHKERLVEGIQFHPESVLTPSGGEVLENFVQLVRSRQRPSVSAVLNDSIERAC